MKLRECGACQRRRGEDLDEETKATHNRECNGCNATFREPTRPKKKQGRSQGVKYTFSGTDERESDDMELPDKVQRYICVSADPRRAGTATGGKTFIITKDE